jgi:hypothetical protein
MHESSVPVTCRKSSAGLGESFVFVLSSSSEAAVALPEVGPIITHSPFFHLQFNFVGRILGPRGMTAKQLEQETGCKIMVRGRGSMRDKKKVSAHSGPDAPPPGNSLIKCLLSYVQITGSCCLQGDFI